MQLAKVFLHLLIIKWVKCTMEPFIIGGYNARGIESFPHSVFVEVRSVGRTWSCGASVLNQLVLLSAAHCFIEAVKDPKRNVTTFAGHEQFKKARVKRKVTNIIVHKSYSLETKRNDIALLALEKGLPLDSYIKRVIIRKRFEENDLTQIRVAGWGLINENPETRSETLKFVEQKLQTAAMCEIYILKSLQPGTMCAASLDYMGYDGKTHERPSAGDSGSALVTVSNEQIGIVSLRNMKAPNVLIYTNVTYFYDWIQDNSKKIYCKQ